MYKWHIVLIVILTTLAYVNIFQNTFVIDDQYFIEEWELTRSWSSVGQMVLGANPASQPGVYRPIRSLLYLVYYQLWGTNPVPYHLHSLLVHILSTLLVYFIIKKLIGYWALSSKGGSAAGGDIGNSINAPFVGALMFGLHPIHTESITYIAASMEMTGVVFFFASFYLYLVDKKWPAITLALLAFFTYEMTLTLPLLLVLYELTLGERVREPCARGPLAHAVSTLQKTMWKIWPYFVAAGAFLSIRFALGVGLSRGDYLAYSFYHTQLVMSQMWVKYISILFFPVTLSHNHTILPGFEAFMTPYSDQAAILRQSILDPEILLSIGMIGGILMIGWKLRKNMPLVSFGIGWFFISLLPVAYIFPQGTAFAEKYLYIASFGFVVLLIGLIREIGRMKGDMGKLGLIIIGVILFLYGIRTAIRNMNWQSPQSLWEHETVIHPQSELAWYTLGVIYTKQGKPDQAIHAYQNALILKPALKEAQNNLDILLKYEKNKP